MSDGLFTHPIVEFAMAKKDRTIRAETPTRNARRRCRRPRVPARPNSQARSRTRRAVTDTTPRTTSVDMTSTVVTQP